MTMSCGIQRLPGTKYRFGNRKYIHRKRGHQRSTQSCPAAGAEVGVIDDSSDDDVEEICTVQETKTLRPSEATARECHCAIATGLFVNGEERTTTLCAV